MLYIIIFGTRSFPTATRMPYFCLYIYLWAYGTKVCWKFDKIVSVVYILFEIICLYFTIGYVQGTNTVPIASAHLRTRFSTWKALRTHLSTLYVVGLVCYIAFCIVQLFGVYSPCCLLQTVLNNTPQHVYFRFVNLPFVKVLQ